MKVTFKYGIGTFQGKIDNSVFWPQKSGLASLMRKFTYPKLTSQNTKIGKIGKNLAIIWQDLEPDYCDNLRLYAQRYYVQYGSEGSFDPARSPYAFYTHMIWEWSKSFTDTDLETLTYEDLSVTGIQISTVKNAIDNGYLRTIDQYDDQTTGF